MNDKEKIEVGSMLYSKSDKALGWVANVYDDRGSYNIQWSDGSEYEMYSIDEYISDFHDLTNE